MKSVLKTGIVISFMLFTAIIFSACSPALKPSQSQEDTSLMEEVSDIPVVQGKGTGKWNVWKYPTPFEAEAEIAGVSARCVSLPYLEYKYTDVSSGDSEWMMQFKVDEYTEIGDKHEYGRNVFEYRNLKMIFAGGTKTCFLRNFWDGNMYEYNKLLSGTTSGKDIEVGMIAKTGTHLFAGKEFQEALAELNEMEIRETAKGGGTLAAAETVVSGGYLEPYAFKTNSDKDGDYFAFSVTAQYNDGYGDDESIGAILLSFDVYNTDTEETIPVTQCIKLDYITKSE